MASGLGAAFGACRIMFLCMFLCATVAAMYKLHGNNPILLHIWGTVLWIIFVLAFWPAVLTVALRSTISRSDREKISIYMLIVATIFCMVVLAVTAIYLGMPAEFWALLHI